MPDFGVPVLLTGFETQHKLLPPFLFVFGFEVWVPKPHRYSHASHALTMFSLSSSLFAGLMLSSAFARICQGVCVARDETVDGALGHTLGYWLKSHNYKVRKAAEDKPCDTWLVKRESRITTYLKFSRRPKLVAELGWKQYVDSSTSSSALSKSSSRTAWPVFDEIASRRSSNH